jgi:hypothetical protein
MPIIDNSINKFIADTLMAENDAREHEHESSGKLSASILYQPLRFQVLKTIGAPRRPLDAYVLGKFARGNQVEDWFVEQLKKMGLLLDTQKKLEYRDCIGFADAVVDSDKMYCKKGIMPHECKSVTNMKLKRIAQTEVDYHYKMQACYYAMAMNASHFAVDILSGEDLQVTIYIFPVGDMRNDVDRAITAYQEAMKNWNEKRILPKFVANPKVPWTANFEYAPFVEFWATAPDDQVIAKLTELGIIK